MKPRILMIAKKPICLDYFATTFYPKNAEDGDFGTDVTVRRKAWQCTLCKKWQEYQTITMGEQEHVVRGCGGSSQFYDGHRIDHCCSFVCSAKANALMGANQAPAPQLKRRKAGKAG